MKYNLLEMMFSCISVKTKLNIICRTYLHILQFLLSPFTLKQQPHSIGLYLECLLDLVTFCHRSFLQSSYCHTDCGHPNLLMSHLFDCNGISCPLYYQYRPIFSQSALTQKCHKITLSLNFLFFPPFLNSF